MFDAIRNWFEVRAAMKDERKLRTGRSTMNTLIVIDKLKHVGEMLQAGQRSYAIEGLEEMLARYPDEAGELPETVGLLMSVGRLDEAEALAVRGMQRNPDSRDYMRLYGEVADHRGDTAERLRRWRAFRRRYPAFGLSFRMEAKALLAAGEDAAAEQVLADGMAIVTDDVDLAIDYAARAQAREDWPEALRRWANLRDNFQDPIGSTRLAGILSDQGLHDQAEAELKAARKRFPLVPQIVEELAWLAERRGDQDGALAYWAELRRDLPYIIQGYSQGARLARQRGDHATADQLTIEGAGRAPNDSLLQYEFAKIPERLGDWTEALRRWTLARERFPTNPTPYRHEAIALCALGRSAEADDLLTAACEQFPDAADLHQQLATIAEASGNHALAARRWQAAVVAAPGMWWLHIGLARALERGGDRAGADDALAAAIARLPDEPVLYADYAVLAAQDGRADVAAARWETARQRFGLHPTLAGAEAGWLRGQGRLAEAKAILGAASQQAPDSAGLLHDLGHLAAQEQDWPEAERCWRAILVLQPQTGWAHGELARALREQGRAAEAEGVLADAWAQHQQDFGIGAAWAREASEAKDWPEARRRWALLRERFPAEGHPVWQEGIALREAGETEQAGALFAAGAERFPADASFPHDLARLAEARQDHAQAEHWWRRYQALQPEAWWCWLGLAAAVHAQGRVEEAEELLLRGDEACPTIQAFLHVRAEWARNRRDWPEAERRAAVLAERFPDAWEGLWGQAIAVREQGRPDEARALLLRGADRHSNINVFAHDLARLAESRAEWAEAERWWRAFLALDDNPPWAHGALAHALYRQGRTDAADRHLLDAAGRHTDDIAFHQQYALAAEHLGDPVLSRQRWRTVVERFPDDAKSLGHLAGAHAATGDTEEATRLLVAGLERFPDDRAFIRALMTIAADRRDEAAAAKWRARLVEMLRQALEQQPDDPGLLIEFVHAMATLPQGEWPVPAPQIERSLQAAVDRGNPDALLHAAYAGIAAGRADWPEQYRRLQASMERFPNDGYLRTKLFAAREIMLAAAEHGPPDDHRAAAPDGAHPDLPPGELVLYFESLGGGGAHEEGWGFGCEFGYFQREYGQEPLSLLRWASIGPKYLIRALNEDFAGFGNPEAIRLADDSGDDWSVDDSVYHSRFDHTHLSRANVPRDEAQRLVAMRMKFLARKLVGDLQAGEKIFVYRVIDRELTQAAILRLAQAVNRFGRNIMLFVALADEHHPAFQVRHVHPGLMIGYIDFFRARGGQFREWNHDGWLRLCREALRVWQANTPESLELPEIPDERNEAVPQMNASQSMEARVGWEAFKEAALQAGQAGRPDEAEQHLRLGAERHPDIADFPHDLARRAEARGNHAEAEVYWRRYTALEPSAWWGWVGIACAVRAQGRIEDAETVLLEGHQACPGVPAFLHLGADWARQRQDWPEAEHRAALLTAQFPEVWEGPWGQALAAREQGRIEEARTILLGGAEQYPGNIFFAHDLASLAKARADWAEAERWWRRYLELDDSQAWAHGELSAALEMQGRGTEADAVLRAAVDRHRDEPAFHRQYAVAASHRGNPTLALQRWEQVIERFPEDTHALRHLAGAYAANNDTERAIRLLESGLARLPEERDFARLLLEIALRRGETAAVARWRAHLVGMLRPALERELDEPDLLVETFHTLKDLPQGDWPIPAPRVERSMQEAIERGNANGFLHAAYAAMAAGRGDWAEQHRRLEASVRRFPTDSFLRTKMFEAREIILAQGEDDAPAIRSPSFAQAVAADMPAADVVLRFESLGGGGANEVGRGFGCEFGYFQREYGQEPLSLLRWASIGRSNLIRALREGFAGFGQAENIELNEEHGDDWGAIDTVYHSQFDHTHLSRATVTRQEAQRLIAMRMKFLARKLVNDLTSGEKIFVYRVIDCTLDEPTILRLAQEVNRYGNNVLLFVTLADDRHPAFHVRHVHPGLMVGYIDHFEVSFGLAQGRNHTGWLRLCREALRVWQAGAPETPELPSITDNEGEAQAQAENPPAAGGDGMNEAMFDAARDTSDTSPIPRDFAAACAWARQAAETSDWMEARQRWAQLRDRFPAEGHPWWQEAVALREAGNLPEAQALLMAGAERYPHDSSFPHDLARLAEGRGDWPEAERWWRVFLGLHPNLWWAHTGLAQALTQQDRLDDAEAVLWAAHEALPNDHPILLDYARLAEQRRDWAETERRFRHLADRFPDVSDGPWRLAAAAREQGRIDEAEQLLREGFERHPNSIHFANDLAHLAQARGDWAAAEQWWRALLAIDPNTWWAHTALANALHQQGRRSDAEAVLLAAHAALPGEPNILIDHARLAEHAGDWPAALERWTLMVDRLPADPRGHVERAAALRRLGRLDEADAGLIVAAERFPREPRPLHDLARAAEMRADWAAAERWWRAHGAADPNAWEAQVGLAAALCQQGDVPPAMAILQALAARPDRDPFRIAMMATVAFDHAPDVTAPWLEQLARDLAGVISSGQAPPLAWLAHANLAKRREQFEECRARLEDAAARFPEDRGIWLALADARELAPRDSEAGPAPPVVGAAAVEQDADRRLLESFESLGGTPGGCEFGLHQRDHGFEPLSLLRWASIAPDQLCRLLEQHCEGLGAPQTVSLRTQGHPDWQAVELTYDIQMDHTHLDRKTVPIETATRLVCTRLKFLARKLIDDLRTGEKVFVYRLSDATIPPDLAARLQQAVAAYGDARLLLVGEGTPATPPIELQRLSPRCLQIIRAPIGQTATHAARLASWQAICRAAADEFGLAAMAEAGTP